MWVLPRPKEERTENKLCLKKRLSCSFPRVLALAEQLDLESRNIKLLLERTGVHEVAASEITYVGTNFFFSFFLLKK